MVDEYEDEEEEGVYEADAGERAGEGGEEVKGVEVREEEREEGEEGEGEGPEVDETMAANALASVI